MNFERKISLVLQAAIALGFSLAGCNGDSLVEKSTAPLRSAQETATGEQSSAKETISVRGLLTHFRQDVKSTEAWLGHEFKVGETPIRATKKVPRDLLMKLAGENVAIKGHWNAGTNWKPPKRTDENFHLQAPTFPEGVTVVKDAGIIDANSVTIIEE